MSNTAHERPSWYALRTRGTLSDIVNLLHPPYTLWHLSYVLLGISLSPKIYFDRSVAVMVAFFLGLGIGAHALDETMGSPLRTRISKKRLYAIGFSALTAAVSIGLYYAFSLSLFLIPVIIAEAFFALVYNLEMFGSAFHTTFVFALSWGVIPFVAGYFLNSLSLSLEAVLASIAVYLLTFVQRTLSLQARHFRRDFQVSVESLKLSSGEEIRTTTSELISPAERSLKALSAMVFVLALALIIQRLIA